MHFLSVLTDRVHWPSATLRVAPLYRMCGRVAYLCVAFPCHIAKVCEKFVNFKKIFLYEPCTDTSRHDIPGQISLAWVVFIQGVTGDRSK